MFCVVSRDVFGNPFSIPPFDWDLLREYVCCSRAGTRCLKCAPLHFAHQLVPLLFAPSHPPASAAPMSITGVFNVGCGLAGLQLVNVPMFFALRRLVAPIVLVYDYVAYSKIADAGIRSSVAFIVMGVVIAGWNSFNSDILGYTLTLFNNFLSAAASIMVCLARGWRRTHASWHLACARTSTHTQLAHARARTHAHAHAPAHAPLPPPRQQKQYSEKRQISALGIVYMNSIIAAPLTFVLAMLFGEYYAVADFAHLYSIPFWCGFVLASFMGILLTYSSVLSTTYNSPLATSVTGNAKDIATTLIGYALFAGFVPTVMSVGGILLSFVGAFVYSYVSIAKQLRASAANLPLPPPSAGAAATAAAAPPAAAPPAVAAAEHLSAATVEMGSAVLRPHRGAGETPG